MRSRKDRRELRRREATERQAVAAARTPVEQLDRLEGYTAEKERARVHKRLLAAEKNTTKP